MAWHLGHGYEEQYSERVFHSGSLPHKRCDARPVIRTVKTDSNTPSRPEPATGPPAFRVRFLARSPKHPSRGKHRQQSNNLQFAQYQRAAAPPFTAHCRSERITRTFRSSLAAPVRWGGFFCQLDDSRYDRLDIGIVRLLFRALRLGQQTTPNAASDGAKEGLRTPFGNKVHPAWPVLPLLSLQSNSGRTAEPHQSNR
jgi:hypothetical protein